jgi:NAD(P)-dependent dehydrogenase (short-subunit alcohol dehydrogenase family)
MELSLENKVVLITGASRGIGQAIAMGLAQAGADIAIASRKLPDLEKVAVEIKKMGRKCLTVAAHIGKIEEINNLVKKVIDEFGTIDILVNNAATNPSMASAIDIDDRAWDSIMNLNLKGLIFLKSGSGPDNERKRRRQDYQCCINRRNYSRHTACLFHKQSWCNYGHKGDGSTMGHIQYQGERYRSGINQNPLQRAHLEKSGHS